MKIFGIGLARTGTTTLSKALEILGYKSIHVECNVMEASNYVGYDTFSINKDVIENNEAIVGTPLSPCFELLANKYQEALFIITLRENENWLKSCSLSFTEKMPMDNNHKILHRCLYDSILYDRKKFMKGYTTYVTKVINFFNSTKNRLLLLDICYSPYWQPLCTFLGKEIPKTPFPHEGKISTLLKQLENNLT